MPKILLVDDEEPQLQSMRTLLDLEFEVFCAGPKEDVHRATRIWQEDPDLLLAIVDLHLPALDGGASNTVGYDLVERLKALRPEARVAVRSAYQTKENLAQAIRAGADAFIGKSWERTEVLIDIRLLLAWVQVGPKLQELGRELDRRDPYAAGHSRRVQEYCRAILIHVSDADPGTFDLAACMVAAELHDLGNLEVPEELLTAPKSCLTTDEHQLIEKHVQPGQLDGLLGAGFERVRPIIYQHHRCYLDPRRETLCDYPKQGGLPRGDSIPLEARILRVADVLDALLSDRAYRAGKDLEMALDIIRGETVLGAFDPKVVGALEQLIATDRPRFDAIATVGVPRDEAGLDLYFKDRRLTGGRLHTILEILQDMSLGSGRVADRLAVAAIEVGQFEEGATVRLRLVGTREDVEHTQRILESRMEGWRGFRYAQREMPTSREQTIARNPGVVPSRIERRDLSRA